jgi:hypothetical protein
MHQNHEMDAVLDYVNMNRIALINMTRMFARRQELLYPSHPYLLINS